MAQECVISAEMPGHSSGDPAGSPSIDEIWRQRDSLIQWLKTNPPWLSHHDAEDVAQVVFIYVASKNVPITCRNLNGMLIRIARREAINFWRKRNAAIRGGKDRHVSFDKVSEITAVKAPRSTVIEGLEAIDEALRHFTGKLSEREKVCFQIRLDWLPSDPELDVVYAEMAEAERELFLPADRKRVSGPTREVLVKAQISRSMSSLRNRLAEYFDDSAEDDD